MPCPGPGSGPNLRRLFAGSGPSLAMKAARLVPYNLRNSSFNREGWRFRAMTFVCKKPRLLDFRWTSASESLFLIFLPLSSARLVFLKKCGHTLHSRLECAILPLTYIWHHNNEFQRWVFCVGETYICMKNMASTWPQTARMLKNSIFSKIGPNFNNTRPLITRGSG